MSYSIEVVSIGENLYSQLEASVKALNAVQHEFQFHICSNAFREWALAFQRTKYSTAEIWEFLRTYETRVGGKRPLIIAFLNAPLGSSEYSNLFGSHEAKEGLAVATMHGYTQFVSDAARFCSYYLARYSLSFVNPSLRSHNDPARKDCYFHKKIFKPDIRESMYSGHICDDCMRELDKYWNPAEHEAWKKISAVVSNQCPNALIMKGGGVKGLAFAGALLELERYFLFDLSVGTSAGAIAAVLLAANYSPSDLKRLLIEKDFRDFLDCSKLRVPLNLLLRTGCFPGESFRGWMDDLLHKKINRLSEIKLQNLPNDVVIYACRPGSGTVVFDSRQERRETAAAFAARCSMSIPLFFFPVQIEGRRVYDGGLRNNFPVARFLADNPGKPFIALYLGTRDKASRKRWIGALRDLGGRRGIGRGRFAHR